MYNSTILDAFLFDCHCALFLVDSTKEKVKFDSIKTIVSYIKDRNTYSDLKMIIVENKMDMNKPSNEIIIDFIKNNPDIDQISISIKNGNNIEQLLLKIYNELNSKEKKIIPIDQVLKNNYNKKTKEKLENEVKSSFSIILLGESGVGKTNLMTRYVNDSYNQMFLSTIGVNSEMKFLNIDGSINVLTLWDTAGQERFKSLPKKYYRTANGVLLLFDINDRKSFNEVNEWMKQIKEYTAQSDAKENNENNENNNENKENDVVIYLLGNKIDMMQDYEGAVTRKEIDDLVDNLHIKYYDICCKWNLNIDEIIARISLDIFNKKIPRNKTIKLSKAKNDNSVNNKKGCCSGQKEPKEKNKKEIK